MNFISIENKWQKIWENNQELKTDYSNTSNKKYCLTMFSYPSGDKLHIGHWYNYGPVDTYARYLKMRGYNVFQPQGFDAFGLPAENYAIKNAIHPDISTKNNITTMRSQLNAIGGMFNWDKEVITCEKEYYKWTQWLFLQLYNNKLAYRKEAMVNWDPVDQTVLANEQILPNGTSERSGAEVIQKPLKQWFFNITKYAEQLLDFSNLEWPDKTIRMQRNWIGKSVGATITFKLELNKQSLTVFTTRPDTLYGATYMVISPEHTLVSSLELYKDKTIKDYCDNAKKKSELQRLDLDKVKTGVYSGVNAINPLTNKVIPIWIGDYVLVSYGTGAIMAVPGHDQRDYEFAKKYDLDITKVVDDGNNISIDNEAFVGNGKCVNSDIINGLSTIEAKEKMINYLKENEIGFGSTTYRLKDWLISRQRYWGTPIPIVYDPEGKAHPIPLENLPWELPNDVEYKPKGTSPLGSSKELIKRTESIFGKGWRPEIDTMDTFVCSSWYYLRYPDSKNDKEPFSKKSTEWLPVDHYIGGSEHATMHLLYARFITKALKDLNILNFSEPFTHLYHQGIITKDGAKMSKSRGNTVSPDKFITDYGSDTFRCYLMFMGPYDEGGDWNDKGIKGIYRFLNKAVKLCMKDVEELKNEDFFIYHSTVKKVTDDLDKLKFNTALSKLMEFVNYFQTHHLSLQCKHDFIMLLAPFAPHIAEELWQNEKYDTSVFLSPWPKYDESRLDQNSVNIAIQVNGKLRGEININVGMVKEDILREAKLHNNVALHLDNKDLVKEIYIENKLINLVVK